jgi:trans-aconitate methyltransferase
MIISVLPCSVNSSNMIEKVRKQYPVQKNGSVIFRFPRFFFTAKP